MFHLSQVSRFSCFAAMPNEPLAFLFSLFLPFLLHCTGMRKPFLLSCMRQLRGDQVAYSALMRRPLSCSCTEEGETHESELTNLQALLEPCGTQLRTGDGSELQDFIRLPIRTQIQRITPRELHRAMHTKTSRGSKSTHTRT
jgi:hypothetical protein